MTGDANLVASQLRAANAKIEDARAQVIASKSNVTDIGIQLNTATTATKDSLRSYLSAISMLRDAIQIATLALIGTKNDTASESLVWLNKVDEDLTDDIQKLRDMEEKIRVVNTQVSGIINGLEDDIKFLSGSINSLAGHINRVE